MKYDLHVHTTDSDGKLTRLELLKTANDLGLEYISFTDHNTFGDFNSNQLNKLYESTFKMKQNVNLIDGIEFDVFDYPKMHILGYGITDKSLCNKKLDEIAQTNDLICQQILYNIKNYYGMNYNKEEILNEFKKTYLSKRVIIDWMVLKGHAHDYIEAGSLFTNKKSPTYEQKISLTAEQIIRLVRETGGIAVLAHPSTIKCTTTEELIKIIYDLKNKGLEGIEIFNKDKTTSQQLSDYITIAKQLNLISTSGTDFHNYNRYPDGIGVENDYSYKLIKKLGVRK